MNGGDKILDRIKADCDEKVRAIEKDSEKTCARIISDGKKEAEKAALQIEEKAKVKAQRIKETSKSRSELEVRNALLKRRREEIDKTVDLTLDYLLNLPDGEYFELIYSLAKSLNGRQGEILLNEKDLSRLPSDFENRLKDCGVSASVIKTPVDISGGFILKNGDVEENMDFAAVISDKRDKIEDLISRELFA